MTTATTKATTVGVFDTRAAADRAVADLKAAGYRDDQIGLVAKDAAGKTVRTDGTGETNAGEGAAVGAALGAAGGAAVGAGILAGVIPVIGPVLAIGTLGTILLNAAGGAVAAGLVGALVGWGIPEEDAKYYEGEVAAGKYLVTVDAGGRTEDVRSVYTRHGGYDRLTARATPGGQSVQAREERLKVDKAEEQTGEVTLRKEVRTEHQTVSVPVQKEEVVIERRAVNKTVPGGMTADRAEAEIRIPVREEKVKVGKETVVKEEVSVGKRTVQETERVGADLKKEEVVVETEGKANIQRTGGTTKS